MPRALASFARFAALVLGLGLALVGAATARATPSAEPVVVQELDVSGDRPVHVVRGPGPHRRAGVFLAGICSNPGWYLHTFPFASLRYGDFVGVEGDLSCGGSATKWSSDTVAISRRVRAALARAHADAPAPEEVTVIGYSQGAARAESLAALDPARYRSFVLIASPYVPSPAHFAHARAVVLMAGDRDPQGTRDMREGTARLQAAGVHATFLTIPGAWHGDMGREAEAVMGQALDYLAQFEGHEEIDAGAVTPPASRATLGSR